MRPTTERTAPDISRSTSPHRARCADLILSNADAQKFFAWAATVELGGVFVGGQPWEPIPVGEARESDFAAFQEARS